MKSLNTHKNPFKPDEVPHQQKGLNQGKVSTNRGTLPNQTKSQPAEESQPWKSLNQQRDPRKPDEVPNQQKGLNQGKVSTSRRVSI